MWFTAAGGLCGGRRQRREQGRDGERGALTEDRKTKMSDALGKPGPHLNGQLESSANLGPLMCEIPAVCGNRWHRDHLLTRDRTKVFILRGQVLRTSALQACLAPEANTWTYSVIWKIFACHNILAPKLSRAPYFPFIVLHLNDLSIKALYKTTLLKLAVFQVFLLFQILSLKLLRDWSLQYFIKIVNFTIFQTFLHSQVLSIHQNLNRTLNLL